MESLPRGDHVTVELERREPREGQQTMLQFCVPLRRSRAHEQAGVGDPAICIDANQHRGFLCVLFAA